MLSAETSPSSPETPRPLVAASSVFRSLSRLEWRLLGLALALFALRNLPWRLDDYDQAKQAFTSLEAVQAGHWWFQHTPGYRALATKPPLIGWVSAAIYQLTGGNWELAWRLPSFLSALALLALLWRAGEREWPRWGGALAASAFTLNQLAPRIATLVRTDMPLTLWITLAGLIVWRVVREDRPWTPRERWQVFFILLAAMMTKGPIIYAFLLPGLVAHTWVCRHRGQPARGWGGWWHWALPLLPFVLWLERGIVTEPGFYEQVIGREFMGRFTVGTAAVHHNQPIYFYFPHLLGRWAPWSLLLLAAFAGIVSWVLIVSWFLFFRRRMPSSLQLLVARLGALGVWRRVLRDPGTLWLVCWAAGGLIFMSLVPSKRVDRIFPVIPPMCLILTALLARMDFAWARRWRDWALAAGVLAAIGGMVFSVGNSFKQREGANAAFGARARALTANGRCEVVVAKGGKDSDSADETMLLYLRRLEFLRPTDAVQRLSTGRADAFVMSEPTWERTRGLLAPFGPWRTELTSAPAPGEVRYFLLRRESVSNSR